MSLAVGPRRRNQHEKPCPPDEILKPLAEMYYRRGCNRVEMLSLILANPAFDTTQYQLSIQTLRNRCKTWGFNTARKQEHTCMEDVKDVISAARERYPTAGKRGLISHVFQEQGIKITEQMMTEWMHTYEPEATAGRRANRLKRKRFWAAGVNDLWCIDQHDKLARFGLRLHVCVEPFSGMIIWLRVWWSNSNPRLICHYYLDAVRTLGFIPLVTQSDPGSENFGVANAHTALRHLYDPTLQGTIQHRTMRKHNNIKPEITWKEIRRHGSPGIHNVLDLGLNNHWYDPDNPVHALLFRWLAIPWVQSELDAIRNMLNNFRKRSDKNKILPQGRPSTIFEAPELSGSKDFKVIIDPTDLADIQERYAPLNHPVFELVPASFNADAERYYLELGSPRIEHGTLWTVFIDMLNLFMSAPTQTPDDWVTTEPDAYNEGVFDLDPRLVALPAGPDFVDELGNFYLGGVREELEAAEAAANERSFDGVVYGNISDEEL
ncbi:hypothetical protein FRC07_012343 [Ceratobasidium sp. 392]|nr:hypothetical protein FRC07_012343 [Ceratobasidium sp. 392]